MPELRDGEDGSAFTVDRYGGIYSMEKVPLAWWHWRSVAAKLRHPVRAWRSRGTRADFAGFLADRMRDAWLDEFEDVNRDTRRIFEGPSAFYKATIDTIREADRVALHEAQDAKSREVGAFVARVVARLLDEDPPRLDPVGLTRDGLLRRDAAERARERDPGLPFFRTSSAGMPSADEVVDSLLCAQRRPPEIRPLRVTATERDLPAVRRMLGLERSVPCYQCCGGPKALGHVPGCEVDVRRLVRSGKFDDR